MLRAILRVKILEEVQARLCVYVYDGKDSFNVRIVQLSIAMVLRSVEAVLDGRTCLILW